MKYKKYPNDINIKLSRISAKRKELNDEIEDIASWNDVMYEIVSGYPFESPLEKTAAMKLMKESLFLVTGLSYEENKRKQDILNNEIKEIKDSYMFD